MIVAFIEPGAFLVVVDVIVEFRYLALCGNHVLVQANIIGMRISPVHPCLPVLVDKYGGIDVVPMFALPNQGLAQRVFERSVRRIGNQHTDTVSVQWAI